MPGATHLRAFALAVAATGALAADDKPAGSKTSQETKQDSAVTVSAPRRVRLAGIAIGAGYTRFSGPWYGPWGYGYWPYYAGYPWYGYDAYFYHPFYGTGFARGPGMGEIRLRTGQKNAEVFIDGAYAGTVAELKKMWLDPGAYNLEVRSGGESFHRRIYVLSGKTLHIQAQLAPATGEEKP